MTVFFLQRRHRALLGLALGLWLGLGAPAPTQAAPAGAGRLAARTLDQDAIARARFGNDAPWYRERIPFLETSDPLLDDVYYYRWQIVRAHQRDLGAAGYITTEFADDVAWQYEPAASLNDATGFHLAELRWLRDRRLGGDYLDHMLEGGGDNRHFSDYIADTVWSRYLVDGDQGDAVRHLPALRRLYDAWYDHLDWSKNLYWISPLLDATEYTVASIDASGGTAGFWGGEAFRPSINSYMFANARALSHLATLAGEPTAAADYAGRAASIKQHVEADLWNPALQHYTDRFKVDNEFVHYWEPIRGRELVGYVPWAFDLPEDDPRYAAAWTHLLSPAELAGPFGLRTVEPSYPHYMRQWYRKDGRIECQWNGPVWPFQTTQALLGMINLLDHYHQSAVTRADFLRLLRQYARLHRQGNRLDLEENYHPDTGQPIVGLPRSHHYFHSAFNDLVLTGVIGIRPRVDDVLEVNPLLPAAGEREALRWFHVEQVPYHGHLVAVTYDQNGRHFGRGRGLRIEVDGREVASAPVAARLLVPLPRMENTPIARPIDRAVQLDRDGFPKLAASSNPDPEALHEAVDGRVQLLPELINGWTATGEAREQWFSLDLGKVATLSRAELAFSSDGTRIAVPSAYKLQQWHDHAWSDLATGATPAVPNGITELRWAPKAAARYRLVVQQPPGRSIRLVELKLF